MRDWVLIVSLAATAAVLSLIPLERGITHVIVRSVGFGLLVGALAAWANVWVKARQKIKVESDRGNSADAKGQP
jgi:hypothetical protein